jgi:signal transduction histidine kinase
MQKSFRISFQWQILAISLVVLAVGAGLYTWITANLMVSSLDRQLGMRLGVVARLFQEELPWPQLAAYFPGDQGTQSYQNDVARLEQFNLAYGLERASLLTADGHILIDSGALKPGDWLEKISTTLPRETLLHRDAQRRWAKTYYFPLTGKTLLRLEAGPEMLRVLDTLQNRRWLALGAGASLAFFLSWILARWLGQRLSRLSEAFRRLQEGEPGVQIRASGEDEIAFVSRGFNAMAQELERRQQRERTEHERRVTELRILAGGVAHEIRNPLGAIAGLGELLERQPNLKNDAESRELLGRLRGEIDRLDVIVKDVLAYARQPKLTLAPLSVEALLAEAARGDAQCRLESTPPYPSLTADAAGVQTILRNLVSNAREAAGPAGEVRLGARKRPGRILFYVADSGPGVPENERLEIFQPFFTRKPKGAGLGLAIARNIAEAHAGYLRLADTPQGAVFVLILPTTQGGA